MLYLLMLVSSARMLSPAFLCFSCFTTACTYALLMYMLCLLCYRLYLCFTFVYRARMLSPGEQQRLSFARLLLRLMPYALCLMPYALCLMPYAFQSADVVACPSRGSCFALCLRPYALCLMPTGRACCRLGSSSASRSRGSCIEGTRIRYRKRACLPVQKYKY
jgi:hypothetical protein